MTKSEVIKEFFKKSVLPVAVAALLYCIFKSACTKDGVTDYVWLFILCGLPFGIPRMFAWIVPGGSLGTALPLLLLNFIIGGVIGGFVLVWRLCCIQSIGGQGNIPGSHQQSPDQDETADHSANNKVQ